MKKLASQSKKNFVIADFVCPYEKGRKLFNPDFLIWMNTVKKGRLPTFNKSFEKPKNFDFKVIKKNARNIVPKIILKIKKLKLNEKINNIFGTGTMRSGGSLTSQIFSLNGKVQMFMETFYFYKIFLNSLKTYKTINKISDSQ